LNIFRRSRSRSEYFRLFLLGAFPVHIWAIINLLRIFPSLMLEMNLLEIISVSAYVLTFALFESLFVFMLLFLVTWFFPRNITASTLVSIGAILIFFASIAMSLMHLYSIWEITTFKFNSWVILWVTSSLLASGVAIFLISKKPKVEKAILSIVDRLSVLSILYVSLDILGVMIVLVRNL